MDAKERYERVYSDRKNNVRKNERFEKLFWLWIGFLVALFMGLLILAGNPSLLH